MGKAISFLAILTGVLAVLAGVVLGPTLLVFAARAGNGGAQVDAMAASASLLSIGFGLLLIWAGAQSARSRPVHAFLLPGWGWLLLAMLGVLAVGQWSITAGLPGLLSLMHVLAGVLPGLLFLSLASAAAARRRGSVPAAATWGSLAWGGLGGTGIAMVLETLVALVVFVLIFLWLQATNPGIIRQLQEWARSRLQQGSSALPDLGPLAGVVTSPVVLFGVLLIAGLAAPLIEEISKTLALPLVALTGRHLTRLDGFLLGVAAGAGFAALEGSFYGVLGLAMPASWAGVMLARSGTAALHCLASGLAGLGWQAVLSERRWSRGLGLVLLGAAVHGSWNVVALAQGLPALIGLNGEGLSVPGAIGMLITLLLYGLLGLIWLAAVIALPLIARRLAGPPATAEPDGGGAA